MVGGLIAISAGDGTLLVLARVGTIGDDWTDPVVALLVV